MTKYLLAILLFVSPAALISQPVISFDTVVTGLSQPVDAKEVNDSSHRLFIVERGGQVRIWNGTSLEATPFLDIDSIVASDTQERGLLSLAFHPDYLNNGYLFVYYTNNSGNVTIARYTRLTPTTVDPASGVVLLTITKRFANHNGGYLAFGTDGYLYFGTGDGGSGGDPDNNSQNTGSLLGKMLRIDVNRNTPPYYNIPADNPFAGSTIAKQEIIATGLRNPWRWSFDRQTGDMWIADVGQDLWEEVNTVPAADRLNRNYGWSCLEGTHVYKTSCTAQPNNVTPIFEYPHNASTGGYSITGGYVYRGNEFPSLQGYYIFADYVIGHIWLTKTNGTSGWTTTRQANTFSNIVSFTEAGDGTLYAISLAGTIYKVVANSALPVRLVSFNGVVAENKYVLSWTVQNEEAGDAYVIEKRTDANPLFSQVATIKAASNKSSNHYNLKVPLPVEKTYYRLALVSKTGQMSYSDIVSVNGSVRNRLTASLTGKNIYVTLPQGTSYIELLDETGKTLTKQSINAGVRQTNIPLNFSPKGIYTIRALSNGGWQAVQVLY